MSARVVETRFFAKVRQEGDCWLWTDKPNKNGQGTFREPATRTAHLAHRWSYEFLIGPIPTGLVLMHACDNGLCVNPQHVDVVTRAIKNSLYATPVADRFWSRVVEAESGCWEWTGTLGADGYGRIFPREGVGILSHRWSYEALVAEIPEGLQLDHLCRNRACVNPWHLEPVTGLVNWRRGESPTAQNARKTHCRRNHPFDAANTYRDRSGKRSCRTCHREGEARRRARSAA